LKEETVKITISLSKTSIDFFKKEAKKYNTQYQKMIRPNAQPTRVGVIRIITSPPPPQY
jgi:hypothetical protein